MPNLRIPIRSGVHRVAAIALYRALLTQCRALSLEKVHADELQNIIRNRFKQARHSQSTRQLRISFQAGYEAIDHLDAAVAGDEGSKRYIMELLERAPARIKIPPASTLTLKKEKKATEVVEKDEAAQRPRVPIFDRPLPLEELSGRRHVPVLFNANHIPVLRIKKPQPKSLSRFLRQRIEQRQERHDRRWRLYSEREMAAREDEWDHLIDAPVGAPQAKTLAQAMNNGRSKAAEPKWTAVVQDAIVEVQRKLDEEREKNKAMAEKMQAVVDREKEMFDVERADRKRVRRREYRHRRKERLSNERPASLEDGDINTSDSLSEPG